MVEGRKATSLVENIVDQWNTADTVVASWKAYWYRSLVHKARRRGCWPNASLVWRVATKHSFCLPLDSFPRVNSVETTQVLVVMVRERSGALMSPRGPGAVALTLGFTSLRSHPVTSFRWGCENTI